MKDNIKQVIDEHLDPQRLELEAVNRFYDYFDNDDLKDGESELDCINRYGSEEIPTDLIQELYTELKQGHEFDLYPTIETEETEEAILYIREKLRVVFTEHHKYDDFLRDRYNEIDELMKGLDDFK